MKSAVINNLVQEDKREILFTTQITASDTENGNDQNGNENGSADEWDQISELKDRVERLEIIARKLVHYLVKDSQNENEWEMNK